MSRTRRIDVGLYFLGGLCLKCLFGFLSDSHALDVSLLLGIILIRKIAKNGLPADPIGIFGDLPETLRRGVKSAHIPTWGIKRNVLNAPISRRSTGLICLSPLSFICNVMSLKYLRLLSVDTKLRWIPGIDVRKAMSCSLRNRDNSEPINLESLSCNLISGVPKKYPIC